MPTTTNKTAKPRPSFSAPTPPDKDDSLVANSPAEDTLAQNDKPQPDSIDNSDELVMVSPNKVKFVSKNSDTDKEASITQVLTNETDPEPVIPSKPTSPRPTSEPTPPPASPKKTGQKSGPGLFTVGIVIICLVFGIVGWVLYLSTVYPDKFTSLSASIPQMGQEPTPAPTSTPAPSPTPIPEPVSLDVLNGSGIAGAAGRAADSLEAAGYQILEVGNADSQTYTTSEVYASADLQDEEALIADLNEIFDTTTAEITGTLDPDESTASARIIIGKDWAE